MTLKQALQSELLDSEFKKEYDSYETEYVLIQSFIEARKQNKITQKELSIQTGIAQADISKIENGSANPTIKLLKRLADGMGMKLRIELVPKSSSINKRGVQ